LWYLWLSNTRTKGFLYRPYQERQPWLIKAAQRFDETRGSKFISYGSMVDPPEAFCRRWPSNSRIVRLPLNKVGLTNRIQKAIPIWNRNSSGPSAEELAELLELDIEEVSPPGYFARHVSMILPYPKGGKYA